PAVVHRLREICTEVHVSVLMPPRASGAAETVRKRCVVEKAIAEIGVLCSRAGKEVENVAVERPGAKSLRRGKSEQSIPGARTGLKFSVEELALVVNAISYASRCCEAKQNSHFLLCLHIIKETVLPKEGDVPDAKGTAAVKHKRI